MKRVLLIGAIAVAVITIGVGAWYVLRTDALPVPAPGTSFPSATSTVYSTGEESITILRKDGSELVTDNFLEGQQGSEFGGTTYFDITSTAAASEELSFQIQYEEMDSKFTVLLIREPLGGSRRAAEQYLLRALGISQLELCGLNASIVVPYDLNELYSDYDNLGFSTCVSSIPLP